jgi:hypothetical protein
VLTICCWKWGVTFGATHVNVLRRALEIHLHVPHELVCVTDNAVGIDPRVRIVPMPGQFEQTPRCRRRMQGFSRSFCDGALRGGRVLYMDLDVVLVDDITPLVDRPEPLVCWRVGHAGVFSGSFILADAGELHGAWNRFENDPEGYPRRLHRNGVASDQAMLNDWLSSPDGYRLPVAEWSEADGLVTFYGRGYERLEHLGVGPNRPELPPGARIVVLGSADLEVLESGRFAWAGEHWARLRDEVRT